MCFQVVTAKADKNNILPTAFAWLYVFIQTDEEISESDKTVYTIRVKCTSML